MVTVDISIEDISKLMGFDHTLSVEELDNFVSYTIAEVDSEPEGPDENGNTKISIDIKTSNRPDLWSAEGIARIIRGMNGNPGLPDLGLTSSGYEINVDPSLLKIRPYIGAAVVRGLKFSDFLIKQLIQIQDKLDFSFGRRRKRTSIGIYNINMIENPIEYGVVDRNFKFQPLQFDKKMTVNEIFKVHPKGIEYNHILSDFEKVPILIDANKRVLSMPPIINSNDVGRITTETVDVLVEVTGTSHDPTLQTLDIVVQALRDRGGKVESVKINYSPEYKIGTEITPSSEPLTIEIDPKKINHYLGMKISNSRMVEILRTRTNEAEISKNKIVVKLPPWRRDVLHWVDISEEIIIGYGYNNIEPTQAKAITAGKLHPSSEDENLFRQLLIGLNLIEVLNYTLTNKNTLTEMVRRSENWIDEICVEIANPINTNYNIVRPDLLCGLLRFAASNTHNEYPQKIFETGECVIKENSETATVTKVAVLLAGVDETFETIQSILETICHLLRFNYSLKSTEQNFYLDGRSANIIIEDVEVGHIGEIHPKILENYGLEVPLSSFEIDLTKIKVLKIREMRTNEVK